MSTEYTELSKKKQLKLNKYRIDLCNIPHFSIVIKYLIFLFS